MKTFVTSVLLARIATAQDWHLLGALWSEPVANSVKYVPVSTNSLVLWLYAEDGTTIFSNTAGTVSAVIDGPIGRINDKSAYTNNATYTLGADYPLWKGGTAVDFDGTSSGLTITDAASLQPNRLTLSVWFKITSMTTNDYPMLIQRGSYKGSDGYNGYFLRVRNTTNVHFYVATGANVENEIVSTNTASVGEWHQAVGTYNGTNIVLYLDGVQAKSQAASGNLDVTGLRPNVKVGYSDPGGVSANTYLTGYIYEALIYNVALSADDVANNYNAAVLRSKP